MASKQRVFVLLKDVTKSINCFTTVVENPYIIVYDVFSFLKESRHHGPLTSSVMAGKLVISTLVAMVE